MNEVRQPTVFIVDDDDAIIGIVQCSQRFKTGQSLIVIIPVEDRNADFRCRRCSHSGSSEPSF